MEPTTLVIWALVQCVVNGMYMQGTGTATSFMCPACTQVCVMHKDVPVASITKTSCIPVQRNNYWQN